MKTIQGKVKFIAVPVPLDAEYFDIQNEYLHFETKNSILERSVKLPTGSSYTILGKFSEITEEQCAELVHEFKSSYMDSLKSLLQSNGINLKSWIFDKISSNSNELYAYKDIVSEAAEDYLIILID